MTGRLKMLAATEYDAEAAADEADIVSVEQRLGVPRRQFLQIFAGVVAAMGFPSTAFGAVMKAVAQARRPSVIWLHFQECTGCTESLLRAEHPTLEKLILDVISLDYHETLMAAAGHQAEQARKQAMRENAGKYVLVVEGAIPTGAQGVYCKVGGQTAIDMLHECARDAAAIIAIGSCASWGGMPSTAPNPTGANPVSAILGKPVVTIPGCPPNPYNFLTTVVHYLTLGKLPELDAKGRPKFAYGRLIHENCERRAHFDAGRFAEEFGDDGHRQGWCLYKLGCKGPETYANCPSILFGDAGTGTWPVGCGHPCIGCTEQGVGFTKPIHALANLLTVTPPTQFARPAESRGKGATAASVAAVAVAGGLAVGAGSRIANNLGKVKVAQHEQGAPAPESNPAESGKR
jgi:hydrogenase small subunit